MALGGKIDNRLKIDELPDYIEAPGELRPLFIQVVKRGDLIGIAEGGDFIFKIAGPFEGQRIKMGQCGLTGLIGENVTAEPERSSGIIALCDGQIIEQEGKISAVPLLEIDGNLDFQHKTVDLERSILIKGDVRQGSKLRSGRDVEVCGTVEEAAIVADGDVYIDGGAFGGKSGYIQAKGNVFLKHCQQLRVFSMGHIFIEGSALYCNLASSKTVKILGEGVMIGGSVRAGQSVELRIAGSKAIIPTSISAGEDPIVALRLNRLKRQIKKSRHCAKEAHKNVSFLVSKLCLSFPEGCDDHLSRIIYLLEQVEKRPDIPSNKNDNFKKLVHLFFALFNFDGQIKHFRKKFLALQDKQESYPEGKVKIARTIFPGASVTICGLTESVDSEQDGVVYWVEGEEMKQRAI